MSMKKFIRQAENYPIKGKEDPLTQFQYQTIFRPRSVTQFRFLTDNIAHQQESSQKYIFKQKQLSTSPINYSHEINNPVLEKQEKPKQNQQQIKQDFQPLFHSPLKAKKDLYSIKLNKILKPQKQQLSVKSLCNYGNVQQKLLLANIQHRPKLHQQQQEKLITKQQLFENLPNQFIACEQATLHFEAKIKKWEAINGKKINEITL